MTPTKYPSLCSNCAQRLQHMTGYDTVNAATCDKCGTLGNLAICKTRVIDEIEKALERDFPHLLPCLNCGGHGTARTTDRSGTSRFCRICSGTGYAKA